MKNIMMTQHQTWPSPENRHKWTQRDLRSAQNIRQDSPWMRGKMKGRARDGKRALRNVARDLQGHSKGHIVGRELGLVTTWLHQVRRHSDADYGSGH